MPARESVSPRLDRVCPICSGQAKGIGGASERLWNSRPVVGWLFPGREVAMISEIVLFPLPEGLSREEAMTKYRARVPLWQSNPDLIHKAFLYDEETRRGGGVYLWKNI